MIDLHFRKQQIKQNRKRITMKNAQKQLKSVFNIKNVVYISYT